MAFLTAQKIHNGHQWLPEGSVLEIDDAGTIIAIHNDPKPDTVFYNGILAPGFVNAHCHLELSHMKGRGAEHTGLIEFLKNIPLHRNDYTDEQKEAARHEGYYELIRNGVVAVGDISNTTDPLDIRSLDELHYHSFVEVLGFTESRAQMIFDYSVKNYEAFAAQPAGKKMLKQAIAPHAPYSVSAPLYRLIDLHQPIASLSVHNQESEEEDKYYKTKEGTVGELLQVLGIDDTAFQPSGKSSLQTYMEWLTPGHTFILVHNTCSKVEDIRFAENKMPHIYWCLCPNANLYIENKLPNIDMLMTEGVNICVGTDSLASNHQLCILSELYTIKQNFPQINWEVLLHWATINGAEALQMQEVIGTIEPGKKPGIIQITGLDNINVKPKVVRVA